MFSNQSLTKKRMYGYASGIISESLLYNMYFTYYLVFLTDVAKLEPFLAGTVSLISVIWDAVTDPLIGMQADRRGKSKRRFMARAIFPMGICVVAAFINLGNAPQLGKFLFYTAATMLFWLAYTYYTIPYYAVVAEMTRDYDERTTIRSVSSLMNTGAILLGNALPAVLPGAFVAIGLSLAMGWMAMAAVLAATAVLFGVIASISLRRVVMIPQQDSEVSGEGMFRTFLSIFRLKPFLPFAAFIFFYLIASSMIQTNIVYMIINCLGLTEDFMVVVVLLLAGTMLVCVPLTTWIAKRKDRRTACIVMFSIMLALLLFVKAVGMHQIWVLVVEAVAMAMGTAAFWTVFYPIAYDIIEVDEFVNGVRREGAVTAFPQFVQKFGSAIGVWLVGLLLSIVGYDGMLAVQNSAVVQGIENIGTLFPALFLAASIVGLFCYPITKKRYALLEDALTRKKQGQPYSAQGLEKII